MDDIQGTWDDYYARKKQERLCEAPKLWAQVRAAGATDNTILALDFVHFGNSKAAAEGLASQLSEHYEARVTTQQTGDGYWFVEGTTRPYGVTLTEQAHLDWVGFMADVARSHGCVFSTWTVEAPSLNARFSSEGVKDAI